MLNKCIRTQPSLSKEINLKGSQGIDAKVTCVFHESICGSNCSRPAEQTWQTCQHQQQVVRWCALCLNLTACQLPLRGTTLFIIYTICYAAYMCSHSQTLNIENQNKRKMTQNKSQVGATKSKSVTFFCPRAGKKRAKTINVCIQRQVCAFCVSLLQYPVFNREINGGRLFFFSFS